MRLHGEQSILLWVIFLSHLSFCRSIGQMVSSRVDKNFTELVKFDGYKSEVHTVLTSDGYVLSVFRVRTRGPCMKVNTHQTRQEPVVFIHGLYFSADACIIPGPRSAHCYLYADACHDVWAPNLRGSRYSRGHATLNADRDSVYWNFTFEESAFYDLPAIIDYILDQTEQKQIVLISHSQSAAIVMLLCAKKPEYNDKIKIGFGLSPIASLSHSRFIVVEVEKILSYFLPWMEKTGVQFEIFRYGGFSQKLAKAFCASHELSYPFCSALIFSFIGYNRFHITPEVLPVLFGHLPSGTSVKNFLRWGQIARNGFSEYDFGEEGNLRKYGVKKPPLFDLSKVTMQWILVASVNDYIADLKDVALIKRQLPNAKVCVLSDHSTGHLDFIIGTTVAKYIVPMVLNYLDTNNFLCL